MPKHNLLDGMGNKLKFQIFISLNLPFE